MNTHHPCTAQTCMVPPADFCPPPLLPGLLLPGLLLPGLLLPGLLLPAVAELELGKASENSSPQDASSESTSPPAFVKAMVGHENSDSDNVVEMVRITVDFKVEMLVKVTNSVSVTKGVQENCLSRRMGLRTTAAPAPALLPVEVVVGGRYKRAQSASSSQIALSLLVTVTGMQLKSLASSGSSSFVTVTWTTWSVVDVVVITSVLVTGGHAEHQPSEPQ